MCLLRAAGHVVCDESKVPVARGLDLLDPLPVAQQLRLLLQYVLMCMLLLDMFCSRQQRTRVGVIYVSMLQPFVCRLEVKPRKEWCTRLSNT